MKNYFNVLAIHGGISFKKKCFTSGEAEKMAEFYERSGFKESEIIIKEFYGGERINEKTLEEYNSKISSGQLISEIQEGLNYSSNHNFFGDGNGMKSELTNFDGLKIEFESGEKFLLSIINITSK